MKALLIAESRAGKLLDTTYELLGFAGQCRAEYALVLIGSESDLPACDGTLYFADAAACGEYDPDAHKGAILEAVQQTASCSCIPPMAGTWPRGWRSR